MVSHTGTGRISKMKMYPMSLFESGESNGKVSLMSLFDKTDLLDNGCESNLTIADYMDVLERLHIIEDMNGWCPAIRSATAMRSGRKRMYVDPSIAVASESVPVYFLMSALPFRSSIMVNCVKSLYRHGLSIVGGINFCLGLRVDAAINQ